MKSKSESVWLKVEVKPASGRQKVVRLGQDCLVVWVRQPARGGAANAETLELLAEFLGVRRSRLVVTAGEKSRVKRVLVMDG